MIFEFSNLFIHETTFWKKDQKPASIVISKKNGWLAFLERTSLTVHTVHGIMPHPFSLTFQTTRWRNFG